MNFAFPAMLLFLLLLPGFLFRHAFWRSERTSFDYAPLSTAVISGVVLSAIFHTIWFLFVWWTQYTIDYRDLLVLLAAHSGDPFQSAVDRVDNHIAPISLYFGTLFMGAFAIGYLLRKIIVKYRLDLDGPLSSWVKFDTPWYYIFNKIKPGFDGTMIVATVDIGEETIRYSGIIGSFRCDKDGVLYQIILTNATSQSLNQNAPEEEIEKEVAGKLVLRYPDIKALSVVKFSLK